MPTREFAPTLEVGAYASFKKLPSGDFTWKLASQKSSSHVLFLSIRFWPKRLSMKRNRKMAPLLTSLYVYGWKCWLKPSCYASLVIPTRKVPSLVSRVEAFKKLFYYPGPIAVAGNGQYRIWSQLPEVEHATPESGCNYRKLNTPVQNPVRNYRKFNTPLQNPVCNYRKLNTPVQDPVATTGSLPSGSHSFDRPLAACLNEQLFFFSKMQIKNDRCN
jgi:hypothetical protein